MSLTFTNDSAVIGTSEYSLPADTTTSVPTSQTTEGEFAFVISFANMIAGDQYQVRLYEKTDSAASQGLIEEWILTGAQSKLFMLRGVVLGEGWDFTVKRLAGSDKTILWSIRRDDKIAANVLNYVYGGEWVLNQANRITFYLQSSISQAVTGLGNGFTLTLAKNGAAFGASAGTKAEIGNGWYTYLATAGEADTVGTVAVSVTGTGAVEQKIEYAVKQRNSGAIAFTYTVTNTNTGLPVEGVAVWVTTDLAGLNVIWRGDTDVSGVARDDNGSLPYLDAGTYQFWSQKAGYTFTNPDQETVS